MIGSWETYFKLRLLLPTTTIATIADHPGAATPQNRPHTIAQTAPYGILTKFTNKAALLPRISTGDPQSCTILHQDYQTSIGPSIRRFLLALLIMHGNSASARMMYVRTNSSSYLHFLLSRVTCPIATPLSTAGYGTRNFRRVKGMNSALPITISLTSRISQRQHDTGNSFNLIDVDVGD
ncbi:hypothetical protein C8R43DRAFT_1228781 [Mycena crocata]|nr:hypothetical protein C8R43DRAFT_1228781 [Mycena crocata]